MYTAYCIHTYALLYIFNIHTYWISHRSDETHNATTVMPWIPLKDSQSLAGALGGFWNPKRYRSKHPCFGIFPRFQSHQSRKQHSTTTIAPSPSTLSDFTPCCLWVLNIDMSASLTYLPICRSSQSGAVWLKPLEVLGRIERARQVELKRGVD